jgi:cell division protein FtsQ
VNDLHELDEGSRYDVDGILRRKKQLKRKKKRRRIKITFFVILITGLLIGAGLSPLFTIVNVSAEDSPHYTGDEIKAYAKSLEGTNGFRAIFENYRDGKRAITLRLGAVEDKLAKIFPYARDVKVAYVPPGEINIKITERTPFAVFRSSDKMFLIDGEGRVLEEIKENKDNYIQINGIDKVKTDLGGYFCDNHEEVMNVANKILSVMSQLDDNEQNKMVPKINSINLGDIRKIKLFIDSRIVVVLGDIRNEDVLRYRSNYLRQLIFKFIANTDKGTIDFTMGEDPRFIPGKMQ